MKKLFKLKQWLTIEETANYLTIILGEQVNQADVLRLGLDGHLVLSVNFVNHTAARGGKIIPITQARTLPSLSGNGEVIMGRVIARDNNLYVFELADSVVNLEGVWDLPMVGGEKLDIEHKWQMLTNGVPVEITDIDGAYVEGAGSIFNLQGRLDDKSIPFENRYSPDNYYPIGGLPDDSLLVVRTSALTDFEVQLTEKFEERAKPLSNKERETLLTIIAGLADAAKVDLTKTSKAGELIANMTQLLGHPVGATTIETHLKKIPKALESRTK